MTDIVSIKIDPTNIPTTSQQNSTIDKNNMILPKVNSNVEEILNNIHRREPANKSIPPDIPNDTHKRDLIDESTLNVRIEDERFGQGIDNYKLGEIKSKKEISPIRLDSLNNDNINNDNIEEDNASVLIIILQCESKSCDANITNLKWVFSDPYFTVQVCAVAPPPDIPVSTNLTQEQYLANYSMRKALNYAAEGPYIQNSQGALEPQFWWTKIPVVIVKDSSVSNITPSGITTVNHPGVPSDNIIGGMKHRIKTALTVAVQADLFYLTRWLDSCDKNTDVDGAGNNVRGSSLKWSVSPTATQAIMYTPSTRDYVRNALITSTTSLSEMLNNDISKGQLLATVFVPNLIDFDINLATSTNDYTKLNECAPVNETVTTTGVSSLLWFVVIIIIIIVVAWALIQLGPKYEVVPGSL